MDMLFAIDGFIALLIISIVMLLMFQLPYIAMHNPIDILWIFIDVIVFAYITLGYDYTFYVSQFMDHVIVSLVFTLTILHIAYISMKYSSEYPIQLK